MIDLHKKNMQDNIEIETTFVEKAPNGTDTAVLKAKENNAKKFLCASLAVIVAFVGIVCGLVNKRNENIIAQQKIEKIENKQNAVNVVAPVTPDATKTVGAQAPANSTKPESTTKAPNTPKVAKPGTMDKPTTIKIDKDKWYLTLVNAGYRIPSSYEPDLVYVCNSGQRLDRRVAAAYEKMYNAALKDGATLTPCSGYRSYERQEKNYNRKVDFYKGQGYSEQEAKKEAATRIMPPGSSEHNLGYAMDIVCADSWFKDTKEFKWLMENAQDYGFILRYPEDKQKITGVIYEPWHWRYVGVETAKQLKESGLVLEEYLGVAK